MRTSADYSSPHLLINHFPNILLSAKSYHLCRASLAGGTLDGGVLELTLKPLDAGWREAEVFRLRMMEDDGADGAFGVHHEALGQLHADRILLDLEKAEQRLLILETGTGRITERETLAPVVRLHEILERESGRIAGSPHLANFRVEQFGKRLGALEREHLQNM